MSFANNIHICIPSSENYSLHSALHTTHLHSILHIYQFTLHTFKSWLTWSQDSFCIMIENYKLNKCSQKHMMNKGAYPKRFSAALLILVNNF